MNIFYLDRCPKKAARMMYNKHVVKMILESAQLLCTAHRELGSDDVPYKSTHKNHPSAVWTRSNALHYAWVYDHMMELGEEYERRYGRTHLTILKCEEALMDLPPEIRRDKPFAQPPQCMPDQYKAKCSVQAYQNYYIGDKHRVATPTDTLLTR